MSLMDQVRFIQQCRKCKKWRLQSGGHVVVFARPHDTARSILWWDFERTAMEMMAHFNVHVYSVSDLRRPVFLCSTCWQTYMAVVAKAYVDKIKTDLTASLTAGRELERGFVNFARDMAELGFPEALILLTEIYQSAVQKRHPSAGMVKAAVYDVLRDLDERFKSAWLALDGDRNYRGNRLLPSTFDPLCAMLVTAIREDLRELEPYSSWHADLQLMKMCQKAGVRFPIQLYQEVISMKMIMDDFLAGKAVLLSEKGVWHSLPPDQKKRTAGEIIAVVKEITAG